MTTTNISSSDQHWRARIEAFMASSFIQNGLVF
jgi:hypothetical protein